MNYKVSNFIMFVAGVAVGSVVTWKFIKTKYDALIDAEIESVKKAFTEEEKYMDKESPWLKKETFEPDEKITNNYIPKRSLEEYAKELKMLEYDNIPKVEYEEKGDAEVIEEPYIIAPEEFGEADGYDAISLTYYHGDGVLANDWDEVVEDIDGVVGFDSLNHFGDYEEDSVFVRNDRLKAEYEICLDVRKFSDVAGSRDLHPVDE